LGSNVHRKIKNPPALFQGAGVFAGIHFKITFILLPKFTSKILYTIVHNNAKMK
jgi:hypothetical protein